MKLQTGALNLISRSLGRSTLSKKAALAGARGACEATKNAEWTYPRLVEIVVVGAVTVTDVATVAVVAVVGAFAWAAARQDRRQTGA